MFFYMELLPVSLFTHHCVRVVLSLVIWLFSKSFFLTPFSCCWLGSEVALGLCSPEQEDSEISTSASQQYFCPTTFLILELQEITFGKRFNFFYTGRQTIIKPMLNLFQVQFSIKTQRNFRWDAKFLVSSRSCNLLLSFSFLKCSLRKTLNWPKMRAAMREYLCIPLPGRVLGFGSSVYIAARKVSLRS